MSPSVTKLLDLIETGAVSAQNAPEAIRQAGGASLCVLEAVRTLAGGGGASSFGELSGEPEDNEALSGALEERAGLTENTFTGAQVVEMNALGTTMTPGVSLVNTTAAVSGTQQASPALMFAGSGWKTQSGGSAQSLEMQLCLQPIQGVSKPEAKLCITRKVGGDAPATIAAMHPSLYGDCILDLAPALSYGGRIVGSGAGMWFGRADCLEVTQAGADCFIGNYNGTGICLCPEGFLAWADTSNGGNNLHVSRDTLLYRAAPGAIQMGASAATPPPQLFKGPDGTGPATVGGDLRLAPGRSTGSATPARVVLQGTSGEASSGIAQTLVDVLTVRGHDNIMLGAAHEEPVCLQSWSGALPGITLGASGDKLGFFGGAPVSQPVVTDIVGGHTAGAGAAVTVDSTFTGNVGTGAYTIGDIVFALKSLGLIAT